MTTDHELLREFARGRKEAIGEFYDRHAQSMFAFAYSMTQNRQTAEDLLHDSFYELMRKAPLASETREPAHYAMRILRNKTLDILRREDTERKAQLELKEKVLQWKPSRSGDEKILSALQISLAGLEPELREIVTLRNLSGLSLPKIAELLGITLHVARYRHEKAMAQLQEALNDKRSQES